MGTRWSRTAPAWSAMAWAVAVALVTTLAIRPDPPATPQAPVHAFSAFRCMEELKRLAPVPAPRVVGSPEDHALRQNLVARLRELGFETRTQTGRHCGIFGNCADVTNVLARRPEASGPRIAVVSHFDSVAAGPGVADDLANVAAAVEIGRALGADTQWNADLLLVFTDGEEVGLFGGHVAMEHPLLDDAVAAVNLEARGCCGPSLIFETVGPSGAFARAMRSVPHPISSSLFSWIYGRMPNDTDLSVFRRHDRMGVNLAFIRGFRSYHTPQDDLEHLSRRSVQHQGETALALVRSLAADPPSADDGDAVWSDVAGSFVLAWAEWLSLPLAGAAIFLVGARVVRSWTEELEFGVHFLRGITALGIAFFGSTLVALGVMTLLWMQGGGLLPLHPAPGWALAGAGLTSLAVTAGSMKWVALNPDSNGPEASGHFLIALLALLTAVVAPGLSYLFLPTALLAGVVGGFSANWQPDDPRRWLTALIIALPTLLFWSESTLLLIDALELAATGAMGLVATMLTAALLGPLSFWTTWGHLGHWVRGAFVAGVVAFSVAAAWPRFGPGHPRPQNLAYLQVGREAAWYADTTLAGLGPVGQLADFSPEAPPLLYLGYRSTARAPAELLDLPAPVVTSTRAPNGTVRLTVEPRRSGRFTLYVLPDSVRKASIEGTPAPAFPLKQGRWKGRSLIGNFSDSDAPVHVELEPFPGTSPAEVVVFEVTFDLPPQAQPLLQARNEDGTQIQGGDLTLVGRRLQLESAPP